MNLYEPQIVAGATSRNVPRRDTRKELLMPPHNIPLASNFKVCTRCGISKPATSEFFAREKRKSSGLRSARTGAG